MKRVSDYSEIKQSEAIKNAGAFFAFGDKQFNERKKPNVKYCSIVAGLICPQETAQQLIKDLRDVKKAAIAKKKST
jgi:hypothetical protein